jgi:hypothetical protein
MHQRHQLSPVGFRQQLARQALSRGGLDAARRILWSLNTQDFAGGPEVSETFLTVLRNPQSAEAEIRIAVTSLLTLRAAGVR